jgi:hypothetical protein
METFASDERNNQGLPWRIVSREEPAISKARLPSPTEAAISRWEGEGGSTTIGKPAPPLAEHRKENK